MKKISITIIWINNSNFLFIYLKCVEVIIDEVKVHFPYFYDFWMDKQTCRIHPKNCHKTKEKAKKKLCLHSIICIMYSIITHYTLNTIPFIPISFRTVPYYTDCILIHSELFSPFIRSSLKSLFFFFFFFFAIQNYNTDRTIDKLCTVYHLSVRVKRFYYFA